MIPYKKSVSKRKDTAEAVSFFILFGKGVGKMDETDRKILSCLKENARTSATDLSKKVNLSVAAVAERIRKLEAAGIIEKYTPVLNQQLLGNDVSALMEVCLEQLHRTIKSINGVSGTKTFFVLQEVKNTATSLPKKSVG